MDLEGNDFFIRTCCHLTSAIHTSIHRAEEEEAERDRPMNRAKMRRERKEGADHDNHGARKTRR